MPEGGYKTLQQRGGKDGIVRSEWKDTIHSVTQLTLKLKQVILCMHLPPQGECTGPAAWSRPHVHTHTHTHTTQAGRSHSSEMNCTTTRGVSH